LIEDDSTTSEEPIRTSTKKKARKDTVSSTQSNREPSITSPVPDTTMPVIPASIPEPVTISMHHIENMIAKSEENVKLTFEKLNSILMPMQEQIKKVEETQHL